jgi:predicted nicotinamide N-methyase
MSMDDYNHELLECARYGESEDLAAYLGAGADVDFRNELGNSALHMAAANGQLDCMQVLKRFNACLLSNSAGNLPTHWAAQNSKHEALRFLVENYEDIDMLTTNNAGRSVLTEAFQSQSTECIEIALAHSSSSEDRLIPDPSKVKVNVEDDDVCEEDEANNMDTTDADNSVTHLFRLTPTITPQLQIRELPITNPDDPFGKPSRPEDDSTGMAIWPASIILSRWVLQIFAEKPEVFVNMVVVELGAGCALPGITAAVYCSPSSVYISDIPKADDMQTDSINTMKTFTRGSTRAYVANVDWANDRSYPTEIADVLLGSDLIYDSAALSLFVKAVHRMLRPGGFLLYVAPDTGRDGMSELTTALAAENIICDTLQPCPDS